MAYAPIIVLKNQANQNENFIRLAADKSQVSYALQTSTLNEPVNLMIGHQMTSSLTGSDRHLAKVTSVFSSPNGSRVVLPLHCTLAVPRQGVSRAMVDDNIARLVTALKDVAFIDAWLRGEL